MDIEIQDKAVQAVEALRQQQFVNAIELSNSVLEVEPQHTSAHAAVVVHQSAILIVLQLPARCCNRLCERHRELSKPVLG